MNDQRIATRTIDASIVLNLVSLWSALARSKRAPRARSHSIRAYFPGRAQALRACRLLRHAAACAGVFGQRGARGDPADRYTMNYVSKFNCTKGTGDWYEYLATCR